MTAIVRAMLLAAGLGARMGVLTKDKPKPLVEVAGRPLIDLALDALAAAGISEVVVNLHYKAERIEAHLERRSRPRIVFSREAERLETGGGVAKALPHLGPGRFFVLNGDILWRDGATPALARLAAAWDDERMDALLLVYPRARIEGFEGRGDFSLDAAGRLARGADGAPYVFTGIQLLHARLFCGCPAGPFSLNRLYDRAGLSGRLFGLVHDGLWLHAGSPEELARAEARLTGEDGREDAP